MQFSTHLVQTAKPSW